MEKDILIARLIGEHLMGKPCSPELRAWLDESEAHRELFRKLSDDDRLAKEIPKYYLVDTEREWQLLQQRGELRSRNLRSWLKWPARIAATLIPVALMIWFMSDRLRLDDPLPDDMFSGAPMQPGRISATLIAGGGIYDLDSRTHVSLGPDGMMVTDCSNGRTLLTSVEVDGMNRLTVPRGGEFYIELEDGTVVWLNAESELYFPSHFGSHERRIRVNGEAYIEVANDSKHPFYIETGHTVVHVTGTALNLRNYADELSTVVTLAHGCVHIEKPDGSLMAVLAPSDQFVMQEDGSYYVEQGNLDEVLAWHDGRLIFHERPLELITRELERWYDVSIDVDPSVAGKLYSGDLDRSDTVEPWLNVMRSTGELDFVRSADGVLHIVPSTE